MIETIRGRLAAKSHHIPVTGCIVWAGDHDKNGYGWISVDGKKQLTHRVAYRLAHGEPKHFVCHTCDIPACINPDHLYDGTNSENMQDRSRRGRAKMATGARHGNSRYSEEEVKRIREMRAQGMSLRQIARAIGAKGSSNIWYIVTRRTWTA